MWGRYEPLLGFWGKAPAAKRFPGYYRSLRERWMRESRCYFFCHTPKSGMYGTPSPKSGGTRTSVPPVSYAYDHLWWIKIFKSLPKAIIPSITCWRTFVAEDEVIRVDDVWLQSYMYHVTRWSIDMLTPGSSTTHVAAAFWVVVYVNTFYWLNDRRVPVTRSIHLQLQHIKVKIMLKVPTLIYRETRTAAVYNSKWRTDQH